MASMRKGLAAIMIPILLMAFSTIGCGNESQSSSDASYPWVQEPPPNLSDGWNSRVQTLILWMASKVPKAGQGISLMLKLFWPSDRKDIWGAIEDNVRQTVDAAIVKQVLKERSADLKDLKNYIEYFDQVKNMDEKKMWLTASIAKAISLFNHISVDPDHDAQLIPISITLATIHMNLLRERYDHGKDYYGTQDPAWLSQMTAQYDEYILYFQGRDQKGNKVKESLLDRWSKWRPTLIKEFYWTKGLPLKECYAQAQDTYASPKFRIVTFHNPSQCPNAHKWDSHMLDVREAMLSRARLELADETMIQVALLSRMLPVGSHPDAKGDTSSRVDPDLQSITVGPLAYHTIPEEVNDVDPEKDPPDVYGEKGGGVTMEEIKFFTHNPEQEGTIRRIFVREWNIIDGLQFEFSDMFKSPFFGYAEGGKLHDEIVRPEGTVLAGFGLAFNSRNPNTHGGLSAIKMYTNTGIETAWLGGRGSLWGITTTVKPANYEVVGAGFAADWRSDPYGPIYSISVMYRFFNPRPPFFRIGGNVQGLDKSIGVVVLQNNGEEDLTVDANGPFTFATKIETGKNYDVTVKSHPGEWRCSVENGSGTVENRDVTDVTVVCAYPQTRLMFVTEATVTGNMGGVDGADGVCLGDRNNPWRGGAYRALVVAEDGTRVACSAPMCPEGESEHVDWVLKPNTIYRRTTSAGWPLELIGETNEKGLLKFPLNNAFSSGYTAIWTGLNSDWTVNKGGDCSSWRTLGGGGMAGTANRLDEGSISSGTAYCNRDDFHLLCVEQ